MGRYSKLLKKGEDCKQKMLKVLEELKSFNEVKKSSHRDFSVKIEKLLEICSL